jgi:hypothetical protein
MNRLVIDCVWNVMAHAQKPDFVFRRNGRVYFNRRGRQFSRLLAAEVCASAVVMVVMLDTPCSELVWRVLDIHSIRQFFLHFPFCASPCAITFQLASTVDTDCVLRVCGLRRPCVAFTIVTVISFRIRHDLSSLKKKTMVTCLLLFCNQYLIGLNIYLPQIKVRCLKLIQTRRFNTSEENYLHDFRLSPQSSWELRHSGKRCSA